MTPKEATKKLLEMVESASPEEVQVLLDAGADPNAANDYGTTALMWAVRTYHDNPEVVKVLLAAGADPNAKDKYGNTALMWAAWCNNSKMVQALLEAGANPNAKNKGNDTALMWTTDSVWFGFNTLKVLLNAGADPNVRNWDGKTVAWKFDVIREYLEDMYEVINKKISFDFKYDIPRRTLQRMERMERENPPRDGYDGGEGVKKTVKPAQPRFYLPERRNFGRLNR